MKIFKTKKIVFEISVMMLGAAKKWGVCILGHVSLIQGIWYFLQEGKYSMDGGDTFDNLTDLIEYNKEYPTLDCNGAEIKLEVVRGGF